LIYASIISLNGCSAIPTEADDITIETDIFLPEVKREFRAVWVATVANIDWPSRPGLTSDQQQYELIKILDRAAALNMNAIIFQVRPAADAIYDSALEPWASYLTGEMGSAPLPYYDPLEFVIREAHKRGLELHAWFNPFRAGHPVDTSEVSPDHISRTNPEMVHQYGDFLWLDPGLPEAREHSKKVIMDVVERYDIDGIHFDDYFYPYRSYADGSDFPDDISWEQALENGTTMSRSDWRRNNVDRFIEQIYREIKEKKPHVKFGISPFGIWQPGYPRRTTGFNSHEELYADARRWLRSGWLDYIAPQIYYRTDQIAQPFPVILQWWVEQNIHDRHIWPGLFTSRLVTPDVTWTGDEIQRQLYVLRGFPGVNGAIHFSMQAIMRNPDRFRDLLASGPYAEPAIVPGTPWINNQNPAKPVISVEKFDDRITVFIKPNGEKVRQFIIRLKTDGIWDIDIIPASQYTYTLYGNFAQRFPEKIFISSVNRLGNESPAATAELSNLSENITHLTPDQIPQFIPRNKWSNENPGSYPANGIRRNVTQNDTLHFRDLTVVTSGIDSAPLTIAGITEEVDQQISAPLLPDSVRLKLFRNGVTEKFTVADGSSFNWYGYHVGIIDITSQLPPSESGTIQIEIATIQSLPVDRASLLETGQASQRIRVPHQLKKITLHHTGSAEPMLPGDDAVEKIQALFSWSRESLNWWDLPYHYLIDPNGNVFEGRDLRYAGDVNGLYDPRGHLKIAFIGNYNLQKPTGPQISASRSIISWAVDTFDIQPYKIYGHDDWMNTSGPGLYLRELIDEGVFDIQITD
jgi:uncharacterized lipoprotein YddW (UPF0748 family)